jgi:hypothetical protein
LNWFPLSLFFIPRAQAHTDAVHRAVITGTNSAYQSIADLEGTPIGISRIGSGSQTMAYVMALEQGWATDTLQFKGTRTVLIVFTAHAPFNIRLEVTI